MELLKLIRSTFALQTHMIQQ